MKRARRLILCLVMFSAIMLCTAHAFVPSPEPCEHTNTAYAANGNDCVLVCVDCEEIVNGPWEHSLHCTTGECSRCGATGVEGWFFHDVDLDTYKYSDTQHWNACKNCDEAFLVYNHKLSCTTGACVDCGATGVTGNTYHNRDWDTDIFQYSDTHHWHACKDCGDPGRTGMHVVSCVTGACTTCGAPGVTGIIDHDWDEDNYQYTDTQHWIVCKKCDAIASSKSHVVSCVTGACTTCGATGVTGKIDHQYEETYRYDLDLHWIECTECGEWRPYHTSRHTFSCVTHTCTICGAEVGRGSVTHQYDYSKYEHDEFSHWHLCNDCGEKDYPVVHSVDCGSDVCYYCGATCDPSKADVRHSYGYAYNEKTHWQECTICGYANKSSTEAHRANCVEKVCTTCGMENVTIGTFTHGNVDFSTYVFDEVQHWRVCNDCGDNVYAAQHKLSCANNACKYCGQSGVKGELSHHFGSELEHSEYGHWQTCTDCGQKYGREHSAYCSESTCACGEPVNESFIVRHEHGEWHSDGDEHFYSCETCGTEAHRGKHEVKCGSDVCTVCGQEGVENANVSHTYVQKHDETTHWSECIICGAKGYAEEHVLECNSGRCNDCGAYDVEGQITHRWHYEKRFDGDEVYYFCMYCGEEYGRQKADPCEELGMHTVYCYDLTRCAVCGKAVAEGEYILKHESVDPTVRIDPFYCNRRICAFCGEWFYSGLHKVGEDGHCVVCGRIGLTPHNEHTSQEVILEAATCTTAGLKQFVCADCGWKLGTEEEIAALGHKEVTTETPATCTVAGSKVTTCETCGEVLHSEELSALGHKEVTTETPATCTAAGSKVTTCATCGETIKSEELSALGHKEVTTETPATCVNAGSKVTTCETCGETIKSEELSALGHKEVTTETPATCVNAGSKVTTCETCGETLHSEELSALGHKEVTTETPATCVNAGSKVTTCETCGETIKSEELSALGHKEVTTETSATCVNAGSKVTTCETCGEVLHTEELSALGHKEVTTETPTTCTAAGSKVTTCETCGETISEEAYGALGHAPVERVKDATCTEDGQKRTVCNRCGVTMSTETLTALGHERWVTVAQRATCTTNGLRRIMCARCKALLGTEIIPATGHQLTRTDEGDHWLDTCGVCGSQTVIQKDGMAAEPTPAPEATATPEPTVEPAPMVLPVEVAVKPVEKVEIQDVPATVMIVVQEVEEQEVPKLELPETIEAVKVLSVNLFVPEELADVADTLIPAKLKISIELAEAEEKELAELKLVLILEDGTMQEIEFEIKDGKLVFETEKQGVFAFVPADTII